jgi:hypothetical protein
LVVGVKGLGIKDGIQRRDKPGLLPFSFALLPLILAILEKGKLDLNVGPFMDMDLPREFIQLQVGLEGR